MFDKNTLTIISVCLNFLGTASLAFAANKYFRAVNVSFTSVENNIDGLASLITNKQNDAPIFTGLDRIRARGSKAASFLTYLGLILIGTGIICQLLTLEPKP